MGSTPTPGTSFAKGKFGLMAQLDSASAEGGRSEWAVSADWLARHVDIVKVTGSSPVPPTMVRRTLDPPVADQGLAHHRIK